MEHQEQYLILISWTEGNVTDVYDIVDNAALADDIFLEAVKDEMKEAKETLEGRFQCVYEQGANDAERVIFYGNCDYVFSKVEKIKW